MMEKISLKTARNLIIDGQGFNDYLITPLEALNRLGYIQIDTISVVERAHHHIFWSRCPQYKPSDLNELINTREVFEYWSHAAAYLPMKDYRYSLHRKNLLKKNSGSWLPRDPKVMKYVYDRIKNEGPLQSKDFKNEENTRAGWWSWKPAKKALERLFMEGELEITRRVNFQKVYDLSERVIPSQAEKTVPTDSEYAQYLIRRTLDSHILATPKEMAYLEKSVMKKLVQQEVLHMVESGKVLEVKLEGVKQPYYILKENFKAPSVNEGVHILSPFDNFVIQRSKLYSLFDFDYQIECYVPEAKRKFGYFSLPILAGQEFVARVDCKADRKKRELLVKSFHWEKKVFRSKYRDQVIKKLNDFAEFNSCSLSTKLI